MDNHRSYTTPEFIKLANKNYILLYPLLAHLTYCMQPFDVGVFQLYKHWYNKAIKDSLASLDIEYTLCFFLRDLAGICKKTFKRRTIKYAFQKAGIYLINTKQCLKQLKTFSLPEKKDKDNKPITLHKPKTPTKLIEIKQQLNSK
jgi:hypothetical protein